MIRANTLAALLIATLVFTSNVAIASHPFHVSRAEIEYNAKRQTFEVSLCVWPEDLVLAVSKMEKRTIDIDAESESSRDELFNRYVAKTFRFFPQTGDEQEQSVAAKIRWVGSELEIKQGWLYFEVDAKTSATDWSIENRMFFELNDDQLNQVQIRHGKAMESLTLSANQISAEWSRERKATAKRSDNE
ncbi:DUF6702 family protein [Mariniblastus fucicola]|uniref:Uncharacterized protein n=1 Tax=Mariniblastus fucicola TaxID=980251 RepID=A0A5B9P4R5_9BACT|nr:DUF6702 family protein [Mariniblastus fucicola]QEG21274.1 hypothetical protein MFFC18_11290 [Mariniblastus fucicola]